MMQFINDSADDGDNELLYLRGLNALTIRAMLAQNGDKRNRESLLALIRFLLI